jgi:hypothetical protein
MGLVASDVPSQELIPPTLAHIGTTISDSPHM